MPTAVSAFSFGNTPSATPSPAASQTPSDNDQSFSDAMREHGGDDSSTSSANTGTTSSAQTSTASNSAQPTPAVLTKTSPGTTNSSAQDNTNPAKQLVAKITPQTVIAAPRPIIEAEKVKASTPAPTTAASTPSKTKTLPAVSDLSSLLVQASVLASSLTTPPAKAFPTTTTAPTTTVLNTTTGTGPQQIDPKAIVSQATQVATAAATTTTSTALASAAQAAASTGTEVPSTTSGKNSGATSAKEKKSEPQASVGNFLQRATAGWMDSSNGFGDLHGHLSTTAQPVESKSVAPTAAKSSTTSSPFAEIANAITGTANDEKAKTMNSEANISAMMTAPSSNAPTQEAGAETNILLNSNSDFDSALKQVMHIAQLTDSSSTAAPTRVAIELQTPPGAIVNVYVTKQDDEYRAQLSTNDATALSWVQDKMSSIKSSDLGVEVKWLPPQLEGSTTTITTSSSESNLNWNRDGQQQQNQQQDERSQRSRNTEPVEEVAGLSAKNYFGNLAALGRAA